MLPGLHARTRVRGSDLPPEPVAGVWTATTCGTSWASNCTYGELAAGAPEGFLYEGQLRPVAWLNGAGQVYARFVYGLHANVPEYMVTADGTFRFITDHLGSPRLVVNASTGAVAQRIDYDEWGVVLSDTNPGFQPFEFAGGLYDRDTGLVRFGARDYDPAVGRWTTKDPIGLEGGLNIYEYAANHPITLKDPSGLFGIGVAVAEDTDVGGGTWGVGQNGAAGAVVFNPVSPGDQDAGVFASWGFFMKKNGEHISYPYDPDDQGDGYDRTCHAGSGVAGSPWAFGGVFNIGLAGLLTNANHAGDLRGNFKAFNLNVGWGAKMLGLQLAWGHNDAGQLIWTLTAGAPPVPGFGGGAALSYYSTVTAAAGFR